MGWDKPKCLLPCGDGTLLDRALQYILEQGIHEVVIVVGYQWELVEQNARRHAIHCSFVVNEAYATTNTIHSLWLAREHLDEGILYFNGDVWFESAVLSQLVQHHESALAVETKRCGAEEVKVKVDPSGRITRIGKQLPPQECLGEFIGLAKFDRPQCAALVESLRRYNEVLYHRDLFFEAALDDILDQQVFMAAPLGNLKAVEIDTPEDYARSKSLWNT